jgi:catechol 2,3-dioxygenase-like lactoylglutathione lyase family enzyme
MSFRSAVSRHVPSLQPEYVRQPAGGRDAVFRFSVPVLRVRDVGATVAWYRNHLGFSAETFPERGEQEFAILERDGVQLLARRVSPAAKREAHSGWDLYIWVDGADLTRLESAMTLTGGLVRGLSPLSDTIAEIEIRDPDGYVLCIGGPTMTGGTRA